MTHVGRSFNGGTRSSPLRVPNGDYEDSTKYRSVIGDINPSLLTQLKEEKTARYCTKIIPSLLSYIVYKYIH